MKVNQAVDGKGASEEGLVDCGYRLSGSGMDQRGKDGRRKIDNPHDGPVPIALLSSQGKAKLTMKGSYMPVELALDLSATTTLPLVNRIRSHVSKQPKPSSFALSNFCMCLS